VADRVSIAVQVLREAHSLRLKEVSTKDAEGFERLQNPNPSAAPVRKIEK
jgi:hypothetical protein